MRDRGGKKGKKKEPPFNQEAKSSRGSGAVHDYMTHKALTNNGFLEKDGNERGELNAAPMGKAGPLGTT